MQNSQCASWPDWPSIEDQTSLTFWHCLLQLSLSSVLCVNLLQLHAALQQQAAMLEAAAASQQEALAAQHAADLAELKQAHADAHQQQLQHHADEVEALQQRHAQALLQQAEAHAAELQAAVDKAAREAEALRLAAAGSQTEQEQHIRWVGANLLTVRVPCTLSRHRLI